MTSGRPQLMWHLPDRPLRSPEQELYLQPHALGGETEGSVPTFLFHSDPRAGHRPSAHPAPTAPTAPHPEQKGAQRVPDAPRLSSAIADEKRPVAAVAGPTEGRTEGEALDSSARSGVVRSEGPIEVRRPLASVSLT
jgi:hypothetical protein